MYVHAQRHLELLNLFEKLIHIANIVQQRVFFPKSKCWSAMMTVGVAKSRSSALNSFRGDGNEIYAISKASCTFKPTPLAQVRFP